MRLIDLDRLGKADEGGVFKGVDGSITLPTGAVFKNVEELKDKLGEYEIFLTNQAILGADLNFIEKQRGILENNWKPLLMFIEQRPECRGWIEPGTSFKKALGGVFNWVNSINRSEIRRSIKTDILFPPGEFKPFDIEKPEDIQRYLTEHLMKVMGCYLGGLNSGAYNFQENSGFSNLGSAISEITHLSAQRYQT